MDRHDRKNFTPQEKVSILRRHLIDKAQVSDLCEEYHFHPSLFYRWLKQFFDNGAATFEPVTRPARQVEARDQTRTVKDSGPWYGRVAELNRVTG